ncbi:MAG: hypothetical protein QM757_02175 [Paludibaculum sp.]
MPAACAPPLESALRETLGRPVEVREVRYQVFPKPGLSATDLVIPDEPAFGLEPLAYVGEMQAGISFTSLFTGRLRISTVRLVDASVNLARKDDLGWNFARLLGRMATNVKQSGSAPAVEIRESRINFRTGTLKSPLFLNAVDLDIDPPDATGGSLQWRYEASPARTDRSEEGFGRFTGSGKWRAAGGGDGTLAVELELDRSPIGEFLTLLTGHDLGVQGRFSTRTSLDGPLQQHDRQRLRRTRGCRPLHLLRPPRQPVGPRLRRHLEPARETLQIATRKPREKAPLPLTVQLECRRILLDPQWSASFAFDEIPAPALLDFGRRLGAKMPEELTVLGKVVGSISYAQSKPLEGSVELREGKVTLGAAGPLALETAQVSLSGEGVLPRPRQGRHPRRPSGRNLRRLGNGHRGSQFQGGIRGTRPHRTPDRHFQPQGRSPRSAARRLHGRRPPRHPRLRTLRPECRPPHPRSLVRRSRPRPRSECSSTAPPSSFASEAGSLALKPNQWTLRKAHGLYGNRPFQLDLTHSGLLSARRPYKFNLKIDAIDETAVDQFRAPAC